MTGRIKIKEAIVVEGRYDKSRLSSLVDGVIIETRGFGIFNDKERLALLRRLAKERGLIVLTDSDGAGFLIRSKISACIPPQQVKHAYIPDVFGKERRKAQPSKEGKLGVEGIPLDVLREALLRAGARIEGGEASGASAGEKITKADFYGLGLTGGPDSGGKRRALQKRLGLPERLSANGFLQAVNALYGREEFYRLAQGPAAENKEDAEDGTEQTGAGRCEIRDQGPMV